MLTLRIKSRGHVVQLPGMAPFRTPATIDVSKIRIRNLVGYLKTTGIEEYEIVATSNDGVVEVYKKDDFELPKKEKESDSDKAYRKEIDKRFNKLEKLIGKLVQNQSGNKDTNKEQITDKLETLEKLANQILEEAQVKEIVHTKVIDKDKKGDDIEELEDVFIPDVDISDLKIKSSAVKTIEQDSKGEIDDSADSLSKILGGKK